MLVLFEDETNATVFRTMGSHTWLVRKRAAPKNKAHVFDGRDTLCRMLSTGGLERSRYYETADRGDRIICWMCSTKLRAMNKTREAP